MSAFGPPQYSELFPWQVMSQFDSAIGAPSFSNAVPQSQDAMSTPSRGQFQILTALRGVFRSGERIAVAVARRRARLDGDVACGAHTIRKDTRVHRIAAPLSLKRGADKCNCWFLLVTSKRDPISDRRGSDGTRRGLSITPIYIQPGY